MQDQYVIPEYPNSRIDLETYRENIDHLTDKDNLYPTHATIPIAKNYLDGNRWQLTLYDNCNNLIPFDIEVVSYWDTHKLHPRWVHIHFLYQPSKSYHIKRVPTNMSPNTLNTNPIVLENRILSNGLLTFDFTRYQNLKLKLDNEVLLNGDVRPEMLYENTWYRGEPDSELSIIYQSKIRAIIEVNGFLHDDNGSKLKWVKFRTRFYFWADTPIFKIEHSLEYIDRMTTEEFDESEESNGNYKTHDYETAFIQFPFKSISHAKVEYSEGDKTSDLNKDWFYYQTKFNIAKIIVEEETFTESIFDSSELKTIELKLPNEVYVNCYIPRATERYPFEVKINTNSFSFATQPWHGEEVFGDPSSDDYVTKYNYHKHYYVHSGKKQRHHFNNSYFNFINSKFDRKTILQNSDGEWVNEEGIKTSPYNYDLQEQRVAEKTKLRGEFDTFDAVTIRVGDKEYFRTISGPVNKYADWHGVEIRTEFLFFPTNEMLDPDSYYSKVFCKHRPIFKPTFTSLREHQPLDNIKINEVHNDILKNFNQLIKSIYDPQPFEYYGRFRYGALPDKWMAYDKNEDNKAFIDLYRSEYGDCHYDLIDTIFNYFLLTNDYEILDICRRAVHFYQTFRVCNNTLPDISVYNNIVAKISLVGDDRCREDNMNLLDDINEENSNEDWVSKYRDLGENSGLYKACYLTSHKQGAQWHKGLIPFAYYPGDHWNYGFSFHHSNHLNGLFTAYLIDANVNYRDAFNGAVENIDINITGGLHRDGINGLKNIAAKYYSNPTVEMRNNFFGNINFLERYPITNESLTAITISPGPFYDPAWPLRIHAFSEDNNLLSGERYYDDLENWMSEAHKASYLIKSTLPIQGLIRYLMEKRNIDLPSGNHFSDSRVISENILRTYVNGLHIMYKLVDYKGSDYKNLRHYVGGISSCFKVLSQTLYGISKNIEFYSERELEVSWLEFHGTYPRSINSKIVIKTNEPKSVTLSFKTLFVDFGGLKLTLVQDGSDDIVLEYKSGVIEENINNQGVNQSFDILRDFDKGQSFDIFKYPITIAEKLSIQTTVGDSGTNMYGLVSPINNQNLTEYCLFKKGSAPLGINTKMFIKTRINFTLQVKASHLPDHNTVYVNIYDFQEPTLNITKELVANNIVPLEIPLIGGVLYEFIAIGKYQLTFLGAESDEYVLIMSEDRELVTHFNEWDEG